MANKKKDEWDMQGAPPTTTGFDIPSSMSSAVPSSMSSAVPSSAVPSGMSSAVPSGMGSGMSSAVPSSMSSAVPSKPPLPRKYSFDAMEDEGVWESGASNYNMKTSPMEVPTQEDLGFEDDINLGGQSRLDMDDLGDMNLFAGTYVNEGDKKEENLPKGREHGSMDWNNTVSGLYFNKKDEDVEMSGLDGGRRKSRKKRTKRRKTKRRKTKRRKTKRRKRSRKKRTKRRKRRKSRRKR